MDWIDIGLHAVGALAFTWIATALLPKFWSVLAGTNAAFWMAREYLQHDTIFNSTQSILEWVVPSVLGVIVAVITSAVFGEHEKCSCDLHTLGDDD